MYPVTYAIPSGKPVPIDQSFEAISADGEWLYGTDGFKRIEMKVGQRRTRPVALHY